MRMANQGEDGFVGRMFPEPVDHGIAEPDRAVSTVQSGTDTPPDKTGGAGFTVILNDGPVKDAVVPNCSNGVLPSSASVMFTCAVPLAL